jgi:hypothetical protein
MGGMMDGLEHLEIINSDLISEIPEFAIGGTEEKHGTPY